MDIAKRQSLIAMLLLPTGCAIQPLSSIQSSPDLSAVTPNAIRPPALGQSWRYKKLNYYNSQLLDTVQETITEVGDSITIARNSSQKGLLDSELHTHWGRVKQDPYWDTLQTYEQAVPVWPDTFEIGQSENFSTQYQAGTNSFKLWINIQTTLKAAEKINLDCGTFHTLRIEKLIRLDAADSAKTNLVRRDTIWLAPEIGRWVLRETNGQFIKNGKRSTTGYEDHFRWELENWS